MRSVALTSLLVSLSLVACVSAGADDESSSDQDLVGVDAGAHADASADATTVTDAGPPAVDATVVTDAGPPAVDAGPGDDVPTYTEVAPLINQTCGGCHHGKFDSLDKVKASAPRMLQMISAGRMPKNNPTWKNTAQGQEVLDFLANSPELE